MAPGLAGAERGHRVPLVLAPEVQQLACVLVAVQASHRHRGRPGFGVGPLEFVSDLVQGAAHKEVSVEQPLTSGPELFDLDRSELAAASEVGKDFFAHNLGRFDAFLALLGRFVADRIGVLLSRPA